MNSLYLGPTVAVVLVGAVHVQTKVVDMHWRLDDLPPLRRQLRHDLAREEPVLGQRLARAVANRLAGQVLELPPRVAELHIQRHKALAATLALHQARQVLAHERRLGSVPHAHEELLRHHVGLDHAFLQQPLPLAAKLTGQPRDEALDEVLLLRLVLCEPARR